jgi:hypothetical protein
MLILRHAACSCAKPSMPCNDTRALSRPTTSSQIFEKKKSIHQFLFPPSHLLRLSDILYFWINIYPYPPSISHDINTENLHLLLLLLLPTAIAPNRQHDHVIQPSLAHSGLSCLYWTIPSWHSRRRIRSRRPQFPLAAAQRGSSYCSVPNLLPLPA